MNTNQIGWEFASLLGSDDEGFADAGMETFRGDLEGSIAREAIQNIIDAKNPDLPQEAPVIAEFSVKQLESSYFPDKEKFIKILLACKDYWPKDKKCEKFFRNAINIIKAKYIQVLKISDYNTIGLRGDDEERDKEWHYLVKTQGASYKDQDSGGSFGIGKNAPFAASHLRTVFYSTINDKSESVFQGKAKLVTFKLDGDSKRAVGSYGRIQSQYSIRDKKNIPNFFQRSERGTDIYVMGVFGTKETWKSSLINSAIENFWPAIYKGMLVIRIETEEINKYNIAEYLEDNSEKRDSAFKYFKAYTDPNTKVISGNLTGLGEVKLYILKKDAMPNKVAMFRKTGMIIEKKSFPFRNSYIAVFECLSEEGNKKLRQMEPPSHNEWQPKRPEEFNGKAVYRELMDWIRNSIGNELEVLTHEPLDVPDLYKYLYLPEDDEMSKGNLDGAGKYSGEETDSETAKELTKKQENSVYMASAITKNNFANAEKGDDLVEIGGGLDENDDDNGEDYKGGGELPVKRKTIKLVSKCFATNEINGLVYRLILKTDHNVKGDISVSVVGDDSNYPLVINEAINIESGKIYNISNSLIKDVDLGLKETIIDLKLAENTKFSIKTLGYEIQ